MERPRWCLLLALLMLLAVLASCSSPAQSRLTPSPTKAAADYAAMETMIENKISSGSLSLSTINAVLVSVDGETKVAHYRNGSKPEDALHVVSVTKSVASALIGIAIGRRSSAAWMRPCPNSCLVTESI
jgi:CubicO group peptidase (beta-lactamase class C family)